MNRFLGIVATACCVVITIATTYLSLYVAATTGTEASTKLFSDFVQLRVETNHGLTEKTLHELAVQAQVDSLTAALRHQISAHSLDALNADLNRIFAAEEVWHQIESNSIGCKIDVISSVSYVRESRFCLQLLKPLFDKMNVQEPPYEDYLATDKIVQPVLSTVTAATDDALSHM